MVKGETFNLQLFESEAFRHFINVFTNKQSGVTLGCEVTKDTQNITVGQGYFFIQGGLLRETTGTANEIPSDAGYYKLVYEIDLSKTNTEDQFNQGSYKFVKALGDYPNLTQEDLNNGGNVYQLAFCQFRITETGLQDFKDIRTFINYNILKTNMTLYSTSDISYSHTLGNIYLQEPIKFQSYKGNSNNLLSMQDNGVKIADGVHHIKVKGSVIISHRETEGRDVYVYIRKNGAITSETCIWALNSDRNYNVAVFDNYIEVEKDDLIQLYIAVDNANFTIKGNSNFLDTQLCVEVID